MDTFIKKGKCCDCNEKKPLDEMIQKEKDKGLYHCTDCHTDQEWDLYRNYFVNCGREVPETKVNMLLAWCFG